MKTLSQLLIQKIRSLGLDLEKCVGIGCDGCAVNMSKAKGTAVEIQKEAKYSIICPCFSHALNLSVSKSLNVRSVKNTTGIIQEIVTFVQGSSKRDFILKKHLNHKLSSPCQTRWIERHDSILQFQTEFPVIVKALEEISEWNDDASSSKANILLKASCDCEFILTVHALADIFALTLPFSKYLQNKSIDLEAAKSKLKIKSLEEKRVNADAYYKVFILKESLLKTMKALDVEFNIPRLASKQTQRDSFPDRMNLLPEEYWKRVIFIPILDLVITDLKDRFSDRLMDVGFLLNWFIPTNLTKYDTEILANSLSEIIENFGSILGNPSTTLLMAEVDIFKKTMIMSKNLPNNALDALDACDKNDFPHIYI